MPAVVRERCPQDHPCTCIKLCPVDALFQEGFEAPTVDKDRCIECGACMNSCPYQALIDDEYREKERSISP